MPARLSEGGSSKRKGLDVMAVLSSFSYSFCSVSMVMSNKALSYTHRASVQSLLVVMQCVVATVIVESGRRLGYAKYEPFNWRIAQRWLPVSVCFSLMLYTSFKALQAMNVPMVTVFKNLTNIVIVAGDWWFFNQHASALVMTSMAIMVVGAVVASYHDFKFNGWGYFWMLANCCATAGYVLYMKFATQSIKLPKFGMVFYNNLLTASLLFPISYVTGEVDAFIRTPELRTMTYTSINIFAGVVGAMLNFASLWCVSATSATTYAVVGSVNVIPTGILGYCLFERDISLATGQFMVVSLAGGFLYSFAKLQEKRKADMAKPSESMPPNGTPTEKRLLVGEDITDEEDQTPDHSA